MITAPIDDLKLESYISKRTLPQNLKQDDIELFSKEFSREIHGSKAKRYHQAIIVEDAIWDWKSVRVQDQLTHPQLLTLGAKLKRVSKLIRPPKSLEKGLWITDIWGHNYFHWMTESLTRLSALRGRFKEYPVILPEYLKNQAYTTDTLEMLGYTWIWMKRGTNLKIKDLVSFERTAPSFNFHREAIWGLREDFRSKRSGLSPKRKVYISRSEATKRKLINETALFPILKELGYEIHQFEKYSLRQQMELMIQATHLVGIHGAGLTNMLYMASGGKILELRFQGDASNNCFFTMASDLGHTYFYTQNEFESPKIHLNSNMILDIPATIQALEQME